MFAGPVVSCLGYLSLSATPWPSTARCPAVAAPLFLWMQAHRGTSYCRMDMPFQLSSLRSQPTLPRVPSSRARLLLRRETRAPRPLRSRSSVLCDAVLRPALLPISRHPSARRTHRDTAPDNTDRETRLFLYFRYPG